LACNWADDFLSADEKIEVTLSDKERLALVELVKELETYSRKEQSAESQRELQNTIYEAARRNCLDARNFFRLIYRLLINTDSGPKLGNYIFDLGVERTRNLLMKYCA